MDGTMVGILTAVLAAGIIAYLAIREEKAGK